MDDVKVHIIECAPRLKLFNLYTSIRDGIINLDTYDNNGIFEIQQIKLSFEKLKEVMNLDPNKWQKGIENYIGEKIKSINFEVEDCIYQGCIVYARGETQKTMLVDHIIQAINFGVYHGRKDITDPKIKSLRPIELKLFADFETGLDIRLLFVFSHKNRIRSHMYQRYDWIHILNSKSSREYLSYQSNKRYDVWDDGVQVFVLNNIEDINKKFEEAQKEAEQLVHPITIVCKHKEVFEEVVERKKEWKLKRWVVEC